jgi:hypothetical protein
MERLENFAHMFSEVVGLGLRYRGQCAVEVSLMPESIKRRIAMRHRKPYFMASAAAVLLMLLLTWLAFAQKDRVYRGLVSRNTNIKNKLESTRRQIQGNISATESELAQYRYFESLLGSRERLPQVYNTLEMIKPADVWLTRVEPITTIGESSAFAGTGGGPAPVEFTFGGGPVDGGTTTRTDAKVQIDIQRITVSGFVLEGQSLELTEDEIRVLDPSLVNASLVVEGDELAADAAMEPPEDGAEAGVREEDAAEVPAGGGAFTPADGTAGGTGEAQPVAAGGQLLPAELLQKRLREHELFKAEETEFITYAPVGSVENLKTFKLQVMLVEPIQIPYE